MTVAFKKAQLHQKGAAAPKRRSCAKKAQLRQIAKTHVSLQVEFRRLSPKLRGDVAITVSSRAQPAQQPVNSGRTARNERGEIKDFYSNCGECTLSHYI